MKKSIKLITATSALCVAAFASVIVSCKKPTTGILVHVNTNIFTSPTTINFVNANSKSATPLPTQFTLTVAGDQANYVYTSDGGNKYNVLGGFINLALDASLHPTPAHPVIYTITGTATGFANVNYTVKLTSDSATNIVIPMIETAAPPAGVTVSTTPTTLVGGTSATPIVINSGASTSASSTITVPASTVLQDVNSTPISSATSLQTSVVQYGVDSFNSLLAIPGGPHPANVLDANGNAIPGGVQFVTAGAMTINMTADGTPVKHFSKPVNVKMDLSANTTNYLTGNAIAVGDQIPMWSMDEATGIWKNEGMATVVQNGSKLAASMNITHLTAWQVAFSTNNASGCAPASNTLNVVTNLSNTGYSGGTYYVVLATTTGQYFAYSNASTMSNGNVIQLDVTNVNTAGQCHVVVLNSFFQIVGGSNSFSLCTTSNIPAAVTVPSTANAVNLKLGTFTGLCSDKQLVANLTGFIQYTNKANPADAGVAYIENGKITQPATGYFQVQDGANYIVQTIYNNKLVKTDVAVSKSDFKFPVGADYTINGGASYDVPTNTLLLNGTVTFSCK